MKTRTFILTILALVLINIPVQWLFFRVDLTDDKRYSLSVPTKQLLKELDHPVEVTVLLDGRLNASFMRLRNATTQMLDEFRIYGDVDYEIINPEEDNTLKNQLQVLHPTVIHERANDGQTVQTTIYPFALIRYNGRTSVVPLLQNNQRLSGEENINRSVEQLEFAFAEAIATIRQTDVPRVAFLEGHGELQEENVMDIEQQLAVYFQVDRGSLDGTDGVLDDYKVVVIADPSIRFSEQDKYLLDQYLMRGGRILWAVNGVKFSGDYLEKEGFTPIIPLDLNLQDMLFRYGVRIEPALVQDMQCLPIPVDVSQDPANPNFQPLPWTYAPLLLTSGASPVTAGLGQVSATFCSPVSVVGEDESIRKDILLATSSHSALTGTPAEVDLGDLQQDAQKFAYQFVPIAIQLEGEFPSLFAHRMMPDSVRGNITKRATSCYTKQIVIGCGSVLRNETQQGQTLPCGFDRYTQMQFANRDFIINAILYLADDEGLINLRKKTVTMRLLNDRKARENRTQLQVLTILLPLLILALVAAVYLPLRKYKYTKKA